MQLILRIVGGPAQGRRIIIRRGQRADIGRTEWADFAIPADNQMADVHFRIESGSGSYCLTGISSSHATSVNGQTAQSIVLHTGDRIEAGESVFAVDIEGESPPAMSTSPDAGSGQVTAGALVPAGMSGRQSLAEQCAPLPLSAGARLLLSDLQTPRGYVQVLAEQALYPDAIRVLAFLLPKPAAVAWCADCVRETFSGELKPEELRALEAAELWTNDPTEEHRRLAEQSAAAAGTGTAAGWVARAAFWSGGSLAPAGLPEVPPGPALTAKAITAALLLAAPHGNPRRAPERYGHFVEQGAAKLENAAE